MKTKIYLILISITMSSITIGQVINVPGDYPTIQAGIDAANIEDTILVAQGTYYENINFSGKTVTVMSNYLNTLDSADIFNTIIDGSQPANQDLASVVTFNSGEDTTSVICGFTITGGAGTISGTYRKGGGILCNNSSAKIIHNKIINNTLSSIEKSLGGGVYCASNYLILRNNIIKQNTLEGTSSYGGGLFSFNTYFLEITGNVITQNIDITGGAGVFCQHPLGPVIVSRNVFSYNVGIQTDIGYGGGLNIDDAYDYPIKVDRNQFLHNSSNIAGGFYEKNCFNLRLTNNIFIGNDGYYSGGAIGIYHEEGNSRPQLINNTFYNNSAVFGSAIIYYSDFNGSSPIIMNCIFWENAGEPWWEEIANETNDTIFVFNSGINTDHIYGQWYGKDNFSEDPGLGEDNIHLEEGSPCIDSGIDYLEINGITYFCPDFDFDGDLRPLNGLVEIGADEKLHTGIHDLVNVQDDPLIQVYPNPFTSGTNIEYELQQSSYIQLSIYNQFGARVKSLINEYQAKGKHQLKVELSDLKPGIYFCILKTNKGIQTKELIKVE